MAGYSAVKPHVVVQIKLLVVDKLKNRRRKEAVTSHACASMKVLVLPL